MTFDIHDNRIRVPQCSIIASDARAPQEYTHLLIPYVDALFLNDGSKAISEFLNYNDKDWKLILQEKEKTKNNGYDAFIETSPDIIIPFQLTFAFIKPVRPCAIVFSLKPNVVAKTVE